MILGDGKAGNETYPPYWHLPQPLAISTFRSFYRCKLFFQALMFPARQIPGWDHQNRRCSCPAPQFPWGPTWFCCTPSNQSAGFTLPASLIRVKYPFFHSSFSASLKWKVFGKGFLLWHKHYLSGGTDPLIIGSKCY